MDEQSAGSHESGPKRFLRIQRVETDRPFTRLEVTLNWAAEIKAKPGQP